MNNAFKFSQLTCNVTSNSITGNSIVSLRKNAGNAGPTVSIGANATGIFNDNTDTYTAAATDAMNYQIVTGSSYHTPVLLYLYHLLRYMVMQHLRLQLQDLSINTLMPSRYNIRNNDTMPLAVVRW
ncbi:MAG: hypothetical protein WB988_20345 [Candidatus Nitrosopolaris sp.]